MLYGILESWCYPHESGHSIRKELYTDYSKASAKCEELVDNEEPNFVVQCNINYKVEKARNCSTIIENEVEPTLFYEAEVIEFETIVL